ncbi:MAG: sensor histidine kinase [Sciscionella sp.]
MKVRRLADGSGSPRRRGPGLRARITLLATALVAVVSGVLLWLAWQLVGRVVATGPQLPPGSTVRIDGVDIGAADLSAALQAHAREEVLHAGLIAFVCVVIAAGLLAWVLTGRLLRPLHVVTAMARKLSADSLGERIALRGPRDEVAELADTFDAMLDRLQATFGAQRRFVADASHELRTPLSVIRTELDVTLSDPEADAAELRRMAEVLRSATLRAGELVESLLLLARTDGAGLSRREPVDLAAVVASAWQAVRADAACRHLRIRTDTSPTYVVGDPALLERVAGNLLENAVRHNNEGGWIDVHTGSDPQWSVLRVASSGMVIDLDRVAELFEPFRRAGVDRTASSGTGLGLSIVRAVVSAHGGRVNADAVPGGGLAVTASFPVTP